MAVLSNQFVVMMALWETDSISITQLAIRTNLSKATMTPLLKKLESKSLIQLYQHYTVVVSAPHS